MEHPSEEAPLAADSRAGSEQVLMPPTGTPGGSNSQALKVAGITTLVCLLVSAQVFTAYMLFDQKQQIQDMQTTNKRMEKQMVQRSRVAPQKMVMPMASMPLLDFFDDGNSPNPTTSKAAPKVQMNKTPSPPSVEEQLMELMKDFELPHFNKTFLDNLQTLKQQVNETSWKNLESWMRYWLIFQMAQKTPTPHPVSTAKTKCQSEAAARLVGSYTPQCDEQGNYKSVQCWYATRQCWCVDESGAPIDGSNTYGRPNCDQFLRARRTKSDTLMLSDLSD